MNSTFKFQNSKFKFKILSAPELKFKIQIQNPLSSGAEFQNFKIQNPLSSGAEFQNSNSKSSQLRS